MPADLASLDARVIVRPSTKVRVADDPQGVEAPRVAGHIDGATQAYRRSLALADLVNAADRCEDTRKRARRFGFDHV